MPARGGKGVTLDSHVPGGGAEALVAVCPMEWQRGKFPSTSPRWIGHYYWTALNLEMNWVMPSHLASLEQIDWLLK